MSKFITNTQYATEVGKTYGDYVSTFESDHGEVFAEIFRQQDQLVAYISLREGLGLTHITDVYLSVLEQKARELGMAGKLRLIYTGM